MKFLKYLLSIALFTIVFQQPVLAVSIPTYKVTKVVDGDTIDVQIGKKIERIRMIGMDTPETVDPRKPVQCFGKEASARTKALLLNKNVQLVADPTQGERDKYGRLLRYVIADGLNFNKRMIAEGYAHEHTYNIPYKYQTVFKSAQKAAQAGKKGLWADTACKGKATPVTTTVSKTTTTKATIKTTATTSTAQPAVKKSVNNLCHVKGSKHYAQTKKYTSYTSIKVCLASGGRLPK